MPDDLSRLVGLDGFVVTRVSDVGDQLDLEVELIARAGCCSRCGRGSLEDAYRQAVWAELPGARIVVDPFHLVRGAGQALGTVRCAQQRGAKQSRVSAAARRKAAGARSCSTRATGCSKHASGSLTATRSSSASCSPQSP
jgi:hypothetical protein